MSEDKKDSAVRRNEPEAASDTEGHGARASHGQADVIQPADGAVVDGKDTEGHARAKFEPEDATGDGEDTEGHMPRSWSDRNMKREIVPVRW